MSDYVERDLESCFAGRFCLCLGSGATREFVGDWNTLLGKMLARRVASSLMAEGMPYATVEKLTVAEAYKAFTHFFSDEGYLEIGEFLLADDSLEAPERFKDDLPAWQERIFSRQTEDVIRESVSESLKRMCPDSSCDAVKPCPLQEDGEHTLANMYDVYSQTIDSVKSAKERDCAHLDRYLTTMAVVELCAKKGVQYVVNYNFDTVVEEMLCETIDSRLVESRIREIHIWSDGTKTSPQKLISKSNCSVILHQGGWSEGIETLRSNKSIHFFHVHGVVSRFSGLDAECQLVFSQHSYRAYQNSPYNWGNQVLQYLLSQFDMVGIGFSGNDQNFRHFTSRYAITMLRDFAVESRERDVRKRIILVKSKKTHQKAAKDMTGDHEVREHLVEHTTHMIEKYYASYYGVQTVWVEDYWEIAKMLHDVSNG